MDEDKSSRVCCLCGDVGFPDKLFRCHKCRFRFQHTYCSNYYSGSESIVSCCDWCKSEDQTSAIRKPTGSSCSKRSEDSGEKMTKKRQEVGDGNNVNNNNQSPRTTATRRYKLLKDVMC